MKRLIQVALLVAVTALAVSAQPVTQLDVVTARRANYGPGPLAAESIRRMLTEIAADLTSSFPGGPYGVLEKTSGTQCAGVSCDIICTGNGAGQRQFDVLVDATGEARAVWNAVDPSHQVVRPCLFSSVTPPPPPPPTSGLEARIADLERQVREVHDHYVLISADVNASKAAIDQLDARMQSLLNEIGDVRLEQVRLQDQLDSRCVIGRVFGVINVRFCPEPR